MMKFTKKEQEVLEVFWQANRPLCVRDILDINSKLNKNTVPVVVKKLSDRGCLAVESIQKVAKTFAQYYIPTITKEEYVTQQFTKKNFQHLFANFVKKEDNVEELKQLAQLINERMNQLEK